MTERLYSAIILAVGLIAGLGFFVLRGEKATTAEGQELIGQAVAPFSANQAYVLPLSEASYLPILNSNIPRPVINARSALVFDVRSSKFLFSKNQTDRLPIASLTKILSAVVLIENTDLHDIITVGDDAIRVDGEKQDLYKDEKISAQHLLELMLVESSNDAAYALANHVKEMGMDFIGKMNEKAAELGLENSHFMDPAGLNDKAYSTAQDLSRVVQYALKYQQIWDVLAQKEITITSEDGKIVHHAKNTNELLGVMPDVIGGKTGNTVSALGCLILLVKIPEQNDTIVTIVLGSQDRFGDSQKIIEWVKMAYRWQ